MEIGFCDGVADDGTDALDDEAKNATGRRFYRRSRLGRDASGEDAQETIKDMPMMRPKEKKDTGQRRDRSEYKVPIMSE